MSKVGFAHALALGITICMYTPAANAVKVTRDTTPPAPVTAPQPASAPQPAPRLPALTAAQIADRNAAARGGLKAWRAVNTMTVAGKLDAGGKQDTQLRFVLKVKRPHKQHFELTFGGQTALQIFDGEKGWTYRPYLGRSAPEPFSPEEQRMSAAQDELDGPLIDYAAKGSRIVLEGTEMIEGKANYRLRLTTNKGVARHICVDGTTFLESRIEGNPRRFDGKMRSVETYLHDYRSVDGLMIPFVSETRVQGARASHDMTLEKVELNPRIEDSAFAKPQMLTAAATPR
jgi:outer membrane lipoprotein-sorting protein